MSLRKLAEAIAKEEGFYVPGTVANRLNNPGNLIFVGQRDAVGHQIIGKDRKKRLFCKFPTAEKGWAAMQRQLRLFASRNLTLLETIHKWAPASDGNDPHSYAAHVAQRVGFPLDTPVQVIIETPDPGATV